MPKVLFVLKRKADCENSNTCASGLFNSARMVAEMLSSNGVPAKVVEVKDNNGIDREVARYKPTVVIIEALWVVPEKFRVLTRLHPRVKWVVRIHSNTPFLANEGVAVEWLKKYVKFPKVRVAFNDERAVDAFRPLLGDSAYLPNFYHVCEKPAKQHDGVYRIGCFGAIRPMKNQLLQALAAVRFADESYKKIEFHINGSRCEEGGNNVLKNIRAVFAGTNYKLVEHPWLPHSKFLKVIAQMDVAMSVSMTETFCITAADAVAAGTPLICSPEVSWASEISKVPVGDIDSIVGKLHEFTHILPRMVSNILNGHNLNKFSERSKFAWLDYLGN